MSNQNKIYTFPSLEKVVARIRDDLNNCDQVLLFAYNGTGKTRLSMAFKDKVKNGEHRDTLYFNAYTEDLFSWNNDLENDTERVLQLNAGSRFFEGLKELSLEGKIFAYLERYATFDFKIDYDQWTVTFAKGDTNHIKVSRGEENIFIWCMFLAICELAIDGDPSYSWVKYIFIDDPISSLDDNNSIAVAADLAQLVRKGKDKDKKVVISTHHSLFFTIMHNELRSRNTEDGSKTKCKSYYYYRSPNSDLYTLRTTDDTPFFHHVAMLAELNQAMESGKLYTHHFNVLRSILEKTASFLGYHDFSACIHGVEDEALFSRALNLLSHGKYSTYAPREMGDDNKDLFRRIFTAFMERYQFQLPEILNPETKEVELS
jgi:hypothetical protein